MCGMLLNDLAVHREIILPDVACTRTHVCTRDSTSVRVFKLLGKSHGFTNIYVSAPQVTLKHCLKPDRVVMRLRVISGSQLTQYQQIFLILLLSLIPKSEIKEKEKKKRRREEEERKKKKKEEEKYRRDYFKELLQLIIHCEK